MKRLHQTIHHLIPLLLCLTLPIPTPSLLAKQKNQHFTSINLFRKLKPKKKSTKNKKILSGLLGITLLCLAGKGIVYLYNKKTTKNSSHDSESIISILGLNSSDLTKQDNFSINTLTNTIQNKLSDNPDKVKGLARKLVESSNEPTSFYKTLCETHGEKHINTILQALCTITINGAYLTSPKHINNKYGQEENTLLHWSLITLNQQQTTRLNNSFPLIDFMNFLLHQGADPTIKNKNNQTALTLAHQTAYTDKVSNIRYKPYFSQIADKNTSNTQYNISSCILPDYI